MFVVRLAWDGSSAMSSHAHKEPPHLPGIILQIRGNRLQMRNPRCEHEISFFFCGIVSSIRRTRFLPGLSNHTRAKRRLTISISHIMGVPSHEASNALIYTTYAAFLYPTFPTVVNLET
jgi:hypothetical protein